MKTSKFYGVDNTFYKLDDTVWEAIENPDDGYRSYLGSIEKVDDSTQIFFSEPLATVRIEEVDEAGGFEGYRFIDIEDEHVWLEVGTSYHDAWYPYFVFNYQTNKEKTINADNANTVEKADEWKIFLQ